MGHQHRVRLRPWFARRRDYGMSAAALELRHPGAVRPLYASAWTAVAWLAAAVGHPEAGAVVTGTGTALLARRLARVTGEGWPRPAGSAAWRLAVRQAAGGTLAAARPLGSAISRVWWPLALPAAVTVRRLRLPLAALVLAPPLLDWLGRRPPPPPGPARAAPRARHARGPPRGLPRGRGCPARPAPTAAAARARPALPSLMQAAAEFGGDDDVVRGQLVDRGPAEREQGRVDAATQHVEDVLDARGAVGGQPPQVGAADHHRP